MTMQEAAERYHIPSCVFKEYDALCGAKEKFEARSYGDTDVERMSFLMTLHDGGFDACEAERYMRLLISGGETLEARLHMLSKKRIAVLNEIHRRQAQLECLDYLHCMLFREAEPDADVRDGLRVGDPEDSAVTDRLGENGFETGDSTDTQ